MKSVLEYLENVKTNNLVIDKNGSITYQELLVYAKRIGSGLGKFVKNNDPVPVYMEKGIEALEVFMGALYAGGFYSLLNVELPKMRLEQIIGVLDVNYIITDNEHLEVAKEFFPDKKLILYEDLIKEEIDEELENWLNAGKSKTPLQKRETELSELEKEEKTIAETEKLIVQKENDEQSK